MPVNTPVSSADLILGVPSSGLVAAQPRWLIRVGQLGLGLLRFEAAGGWAAEGWVADTASRPAVPVCPSRRRVRRRPRHRRSARRRRRPGPAARSAGSWGSDRAAAPAARPPVSSAPASSRRRDPAGRRPGPVHRQQLDQGDQRQRGHGQVGQQVHGVDQEGVRRRGQASTVKARATRKETPTTTSATVVRVRTRGVGSPSTQLSRTSVSTADQSRVDGAIADQHGCLRHGPRHRLARRTRWPWQWR